MKDINRYTANIMKNFLHYFVRHFFVTLQLEANGCLTWKEITIVEMDKLVNSPSNILNGITQLSSPEGG